MADRHYVRCRVLGNALSEVGANKTPSVKFRLQAIAGANPILEGLAEDRQIWADLWLSEKTVESSVEVLKDVFGWDGVDGDAVNNNGFAGIEVDAACEWESFNDQWKEKVAYLNKPNSGGVKKLDESSAKQILSKVFAIAERVAKSKGANAAMTPPRRAPAPTAGRDPVDPAMDFPPFAPPGAGF